MKRVAVIGVGLLGSAVAGRLLGAGFAVRGWDIRRDVLARLEPDGLLPAAGVADAARDADAIITVLPTLETVDAAVRGPGGLLDAAPAGATILQMSTISPRLTRELAAAAGACGLGFLDTPMSGTSAMVARGDCTLFVGGDRGRTDACRPVLDAIAASTIHVGEVGAASLAKLATNMLVGLHTAALAEALVLGAKGGLDPAVLLDIFGRSAAASKMVDVRGPLMVAHRFEPQMKLELFLKDFALMLAEGRELAVALPLTSITQQLCTATAAAGRAGEDLAALITTLERLAGLGGRDREDA